MCTMVPKGSVWWAQVPAGDPYHDAGPVSVPSDWPDPELDWEPDPDDDAGPSVVGGEVVLGAACAPDDETPDPAGATTDDEVNTAPADVTDVAEAADPAPEPPDPLDPGASVVTGEPPATAVVEGVTDAAGPASDALTTAAVRTTWPPPRPLPDRPGRADAALTRVFAGTRSPPALSATRGITTIPAQSRSGTSN
jgi:hypothetical protein